MKYIKRILPLLVVIYTLTSCLKGDEINIPGDSTPILQLNFIQDGGTTINSGLNYFSGSALTYPATHTADTATYSVSIEGATTPDKDIVVTVKPDFTVLKANYSKDSINYLAMPDSTYKLMTTTATIKAGSRVAQFKVIFYPSKIDQSQNFMLPVTASSDANLTLSRNYGHVYFHAIGNPIAGVYNWDFTRYNNQTGTGSPAGGTFAGESVVFAPSSPTAIKVPTGYYVQPNYLITFKNSSGVLSDFKAEIAPDEIKTAFTDNGITVVSGPTITVSPDYKTFTIKYVVFNGSAYRNLTDIYYK